MTTTVALVVGTLSWNAGTVVRAMILLMLILLVLSKRRWDWVGVIAITAALIIRLTMQIAR